MRAFFVVLTSLNITDTQTGLGCLFGSGPMNKLSCAVTRSVFEFRHFGPSTYPATSHAGDDLLDFFLFNDGSGKPYRGDIDTASRLTTHPVKSVRKLPSRLQTTFFDDPSAMGSGGRLDGPAWIFAAPDPVYEFRFASSGGPGFGRISESGNSVSAYPLR